MATVIVFVLLVLGVSSAHKFPSFTRERDGISTAARQPVASVVPTVLSHFNGTDAVIDRCPRDEVQLPDGGCYQLLTQGPCALTEYILLDSTTNQGYCAPRLCSPDRIFLFHDQRCYDPLDSRLCQGGRQLYQTSYGTPVCQCPDGTYDGGSDLRNSVCEPLLTESTLCPPGQVLWFEDFRTPRMCVPDPCGGQNLLRSPSDPIYVPSLHDGKCYQIGQMAGACRPGEWYTLLLDRLQGVCSTLEDAGYLVLDQETLKAFTEFYGEPIPKTPQDSAQDDDVAAPNTIEPARLAINTGTVQKLLPVMQFHTVHLPPAQPNLVPSTGQQTTGLSLTMLQQFSVFNHPEVTQRTAFQGLMMQEIHTREPFIHNPIMQLPGTQGGLRQRLLPRVLGFKSQAPKAPITKSLALQDKQGPYPVVETVKGLVVRVPFDNSQGDTYQVSHRVRGGGIGLHKQAGMQANKEKVGRQLNAPRYQYNGPIAENLPAHRPPGKTSLIQKDHNGYTYQQNPIMPNVLGYRVPEIWIQNESMIVYGLAYRGFVGETRGLGGADLDSYIPRSLMPKAPQVVPGQLLAPENRRDFFGGFTKYEIAQEAAQETPGDQQHFQFVDILRSLLSTSPEPKRRVRLPTHSCRGPHQDFLSLCRHQRSLPDHEIPSHRIHKRMVLPHFSPGNIFDIRLVTCKPGAKRDINAKCRDTILPSRSPSMSKERTQEGDRTERAAAPVPPNPKCPPGEGFNLRRHCTSVSNLLSSINTVNIG